MIFNLLDYKTSKFSIANIFAALKNTSSGSVDSGGGLALFSPDDDKFASSVPTISCSPPVMGVPWLVRVFAVRVIIKSLSPRVLLLFLNSKPNPVCKP